MRDSNSRLKMICVSVPRGRFAPKLYYNSNIDSDKYSDTDIILQKISKSKMVENEQIAEALFFRHLSPRLFYRCCAASLSLNPMRI